MMLTTIYYVLFKWVRNNDYFEMGERAKIPEDEHG